FGHRRVIASGMADRLTIPAYVRQLGADDIERLKTGENTEREEVNPADEAVYYARLFVDRCGQDVDRLCDLVGQTRGYVEARLLLYGADPDIKEAVAAGEISMSIALELQRISAPEARVMYLDVARKGGATVRAVRGWRMQAEQFDALQ